MIPSPCGHVGMIPSLCGYSVLHCVAVWKCDILCGSVEVRDTVWHTVATSGRLKCHHPPLLRHKHTQSQAPQNATGICFFVCLRSHTYWKTDNFQKIWKFQDRQTNSPNISSLLLKITLRKYVLSDKVYVLVINVSQDDPTPLIGEVSHFKCEAVGTNLEQRQLQQMHSLPLIVCTWVLFRLHITMWKYFFDRLVLILSYTEADNHDAAKPEPDHQMYLARYFRKGIWFLISTKLNLSHCSCYPS